MCKYDVCTCLLLRSGRRPCETHVRLLLGVVILLGIRQCAILPAYRNAYADGKAMSIRDNPLHTCDTGYSFDSILGSATCVYKMRLARSEAS